MVKNPAIMSATSSCQRHHQVAGKRKSLGACDFMGGNAQARETLCFDGYGGSRGH